MMLAEASIRPITPNIANRDFHIETSPADHEHHRAPHRRGLSSIPGAVIGC